MAVAVVFAAASTLAGIRVWAEHYSPLDSVGFFGPVVSTDRFLGPSDSETRYMHDTQGQSTSWLMGIRNSGGTSVVVDSVEPVGAAGTVSWSPYVVVPGGYISGQPERFRSWPAHLNSHDTIRLKITLNAAACAGRRQLLFEAVQLRWHLYGERHTQIVPTMQAVQLCPTTTSTQEWVTSTPRDAVPLP